MTTLSVIIPIFNHSKYVVQCLESVITQKGEFEIVAIDDGSSDDSFLLAHNYLSENFARDKWILLTRENRGINRTLNEAIKLSRGDVIFILASDDLMAPDSVKTICGLFEADESVRRNLNFYDVKLIGEQGELLSASASDKRGGVQLLKSSNSYLASQIALDWEAPFQHQFYAKSYYDDFGPYPENLKFEDLYFALLALNNERINFIPQILKHYRVRSDGTPTPGLSGQDLNQFYIRSVFEPRGKYRYLIYVSNGYFFHVGFKKWVFKKIYKGIRLLERLKAKLYFSLYSIFR